MDTLTTTVWDRQTSTNGFFPIKSVAAPLYNYESHSVGKRCKFVNDFAVNDGF